MPYFPRLLHIRYIVVTSLFYNGNILSKKLVKFFVIDRCLTKFKYGKYLHDCYLSITLNFLSTLVDTIVGKYVHG